MCWVQSNQLMDIFIIGAEYTLNAVEGTRDFIFLRLSGRRNILII